MLKQPITELRGSDVTDELSNRRMRRTRQRSRVKMAAGSDLLDDVFFNTEVDERVVSDLVGSLESELTGSGHVNAPARTPPPALSHASGSVVSADPNKQDNRTGLAGGLAHAGSRTPTGVIHNMKSRGSAVDPAAGTITATGSSSPADLKPGVANPSVTSIPNHGAGTGQKDVSGVPTLNGSNAVMNSHSSGSAETSSAVSSAPLIQNGPGSVVKVQNTVQPASSVIQTSLTNTQNVVTSTVISGQTSCLPTGHTVTLVRPPVQTPGAVTAPNGSSSVLNAGVTGAHMSAANTTAHLTSGAQANKADSPKTIIQTTTQAPASGVVASAGNLCLAQPVQSTLQPATTNVIGGKGPVLPNMTRTSVPTTISSSTGGIRAIAPQVLAPRVPPPPQGQTNIQNIQLPPGMVLVRSEGGQLLMIHQQTLAQMQAQSQGTMVTRPTAPTSTPPVHITSAPGSPIITRQVTPTTITKQGTPVSAGSPTTAALQRPPLLQNTIVLGGTATPTVGTPPPGHVGTAGATPTPVSAETLENVKKCKNFLSTLIKLASSSKQSSETAANVKELVKNLLEGKLQAEDFTSRLYRELNSSPQPYLVPFLKRSLPALRQLTPDSVAFIQQSQFQQTPPPSTTVTAVVLGGGVAAQRPPAQTTPTATPTHQPVISLSPSTQNKPNLILQQPQQQGALVRGPQVNLTQTPMVTLRPGQPRAFAPQTVVKALPSGLLKPGLAVGTKFLSVSGPQSGSSAVQRTRLKDAGSGSFRDDDDINDVASMAGVNLSEESDRILATGSELVGAVTRSCKDEVFLHTGPLHCRVLEIGKRFGISELGADVISLVSHATQHRLKDLLGKVTQVAHQKNISFKEDERHDQVSDVRTQLKFFEQMDQMEKQRKEEQEREILLKAAKSRSRQEDPEQLRLKQKAKEMQQQELAQMRQRDANLTALAAIGPRKKRRLDSSAGGSGPEGSGSVSAGSVVGTGTGGSSRQFTRQRITRVNLRDLLLCLENERESHSHLLYKAFLK
ncbi:transcription initiation factor TFIID subunit 4-like [Brachyhypopomus gauderio]|uniref:transcription initiation factor TFIID subunit 4-like n=1 Tax=Brachyhypopomus gauderio TaxID=698409 RepID=UPI004042C053